MVTKCKNMLKTIEWPACMHSNQCPAFSLSVCCEWMFMKFLRDAGLGTGNNWLEFGDELHFDLDPEIVFLLRLFAICQLTLFYYCSLVVSTIMPTILITNLISILRTIKYSVPEVWMKIITVQSHQQSKSLPRTGSDQKEDPAIPGYAQLRRIWSHWMLASRLHGRTQPTGRPGDQWWTRQRSRRVRHEKKQKRFELCGCFLVL